MRHSRASWWQRSGWSITLICVLALAACQARPTPVAETPTPAPEARVTAAPTAVPATPTAVGTPTQMPLPTLTPSPTLSPTPTATVAPRGLNETENILVLGMDQRPGERGWRTDTIIVVAIDHQAKQVGMISIPRDLWVEIPGYAYGKGRINQVDVQGEAQKYPGGGPALVQKVISDTLGIPSQRWVRLRLEALPELVDALGGVTVTLVCPLHELTPDPKAPDSGRYEHFDLPAGQVQLNGVTAAKFARYRYASNDFARAARQQQLIWAIKERALEINVIPRIPDLWKALAKTFQTDLTLLDVIRLARLGATLQPDQIHGVTFSRAAMTDAKEGAAWVVKIVDMKQVQQEIAGLFQAKSISTQGREGSGGCPELTPLPTGSVTPGADMTATVTPTP